jgi:hypothetical protein
MIPALLAIAPFWRILTKTLMSSGFAGRVLIVHSFLGLLDKEKGRRIFHFPEGEYTSHQYYLENTNILITEISPASVACTV